MNERQEGGDSAAKESTSLDDWTVLVGEVATVWGLAGQVRIALLTDFPERFAPGSEVCCLTREGKRTLMKVESSRKHQGGMVIRMEGFSSREQAETLRGAKFLIQEAMRVPLPEGRYYISDIVGLNVVTEAGDALGTVVEVLETGSNAVYVTQRALIPATREVVQRIDLADRTMTIRPLEGLLD